MVNAFIQQSKGWCWQMQNELCRGEEVQRVWEASGLTARQGCAIFDQDRFPDTVYEYFTFHFSPCVMALLQGVSVGSCLSVALLSHEKQVKCIVLGAIHLPSFNNNTYTQDVGCKGLFIYFLLCYFLPWGMWGGLFVCFAWSRWWWWSLAKSLSHWLEWVAIGKWRDAPRLAR